jgi:hypothetical protein
MKVELVSGWQKAYQMWSVWAMVLMGAMPDIYSAAVASGLFEGEGVPQQLGYIMKVLAFLGVVSRLVKQQSVAAAAAADAARKAAK